MNNLPAASRRLNCRQAFIPYHRNATTHIRYGNSAIEAQGTTTHTNITQPRNAMLICKCGILHTYCLGVNG